MSKQQRILPLGKKYMANKSVDYKLYSMFQSMSYLTKDRMRFVYKNHKTYGNLTQKRINELYNMACRNEKEKVGLSTIQKKMRLFKSIGMISEEYVIDMFGKRVKAFILLENFEIFQYVPLETLRYLGNTASSDVIKIYAYLLDKYLYKYRMGERYSFTLAELATEIGKPDYNNGNTTRVKDCLNSLVNSNLIKFTRYYQKTSSGVPTPRLRLIKVNTRHSCTLD